jgi:hypothetical protein
MRTLCAITAFLVCALPLAAQQLPQACATEGKAAGGTAVKRQPRIIVVPYTKADEDIRTVLDADVNRRVAVIKIQEAFDRRGFSAGDFVGVLRAILMRQGANTMAQTDLRTQIFEQSRADIYVEVEVNLEQSGSLHSVAALMRGYLTANGLSLGNQIARSPKQQLGTEASRLVESATRAENVNPLLDVMQEKFDEYNQNGVPIALDITMREGAQMGPGTDVPGKNATVAELIEEWLETHAWKSIYNLTSVTDSRMTLDEVRIPMLDPESCRNYSPLRFGRELVNYLRTINVRATTALNAGSLFIEIR